MKQQLYSVAQRASEKLLGMRLELTPTTPPPAFIGEPFKDVYVPAAGLTMHLDFREGLDRSYAENVVDEECFAFLRSHMPTDGVFVDIGANQGMYTCVALKEFPAARVVAIEPDPYSIEKIQANVALNHLDASRLTLFDVAVSDVEEERELMLNVAGNRAGSSLVVDQRQWTQLPENVTLRVACRPLLTLLQEAGVEAVSVLKIDIEGFEYPALKAFLRDAPEALNPECLIVEAFGHVIPMVGGSTIELLIQHGYHLANHDSYNYFFSRN